MSTTSVRRLKERGGAGGKITASMPTKTVTPASEKPFFGSGRKSVGKENPNPRSISRAGPTQKPAIRPMPRMSSLSSSDGEPRPKSRPRGRSPSPSDFTRIMSDMRKIRVSGGDTLGRGDMSNGKLVGTGGNGLSGFRVTENRCSRELSDKVGEKGVNGFRVSNDGKEIAHIGAKFRDSGEKVAGKGKRGDKHLNSSCVKENNLTVNSVKSSVDDVSYAVQGRVHHCEKDGNFSGVANVIAVEENASENPVLQSEHAFTSKRNCSDLSLKSLGLKSMSNLKGLGVSKEKGANEEGTNGRVGNKHASKLHEKLAYLEGKVKRIASDIKKTKEMLDMNNTDAPKMILVDIQEKISGIEKAMGNVIVDSNMHATADCSIDVGEAKITGIDTTERSKNRSNQVEHPKVSVKGLNCDELEARLFPHHKLLRNRTSFKVPASGSIGDAPRVLESNTVPKSENSISPVDEDPIALEFLASLNKMQPEVSATDGGVAQITDEVEDTEDTETSTVRQSSGIVVGKHDTELDLQANEKLCEFDDQENNPAMIVEEDMEDSSITRPTEIGRKSSTGGWFVSEGESVLLAHDDGSCSLYDIANHEEKAEYRPPAGFPQSAWRDCWIIRAPGADGCSGKYVVAASAGNTMDAGFCSWDFYSKDVQAFHTEDNKTTPRVALGPLPDNIMHRRNTLGGIMSSENWQWWYRPCGPLIISSASCQRAVKVFDIRDGEEILKWDSQKPVLAMDFSSPLQWRNRGKVVIAETEAVSLWDVNSLNPQALLSVSTSGRRISALHVNNTDAELGGGVRQRVSSSEAEGNDGVFCTADSINVLDFRLPSGIGLKVPNIGISVQSVSSRGESVYLGCTRVTSAAKNQVSSQVLQFSLRKQRIVNTYAVPESNAHSHHKALTQVWGNSNLVMAVCGLGLYVFDALRDDILPSFAIEYSSPQNVREVVGPDDLYSPSFDYISSQILLISRDRPAMWRHLS